MTPIEAGAGSRHDQAMSSRCSALIAVFVLALLFAGCGGEEDEGEAARETEEVVLDGISYRVAMFRELNKELAPDAAIAGEAGAPREGHGYYAAFVIACNVSGGRRAATGEVRLENAFGDPVKPLGLRADIAYDGGELKEGACRPESDSLADQALPGAPVAFEIPYDYADERPLYLVFSEPGPAGDEFRVELDL